MWTIFHEKPRYQRGRLTRSLLCSEQGHCHCRESGSVWRSGRSLRSSPTRWSRCWSRRGCNWRERPNRTHSLSARLSKIIRRVRVLEISKIDQPTYQTHIRIVLGYVANGVVESEKYLVLRSDDDDLSVRKGFIVSCKKLGLIKNQILSYVWRRILPSSTALTRNVKKPVISLVGWKLATILRLLISEEQNGLKVMTRELAKLSKLLYHWVWRKRAPRYPREKDD